MLAYRSAGGQQLEQDDYTARTEFAAWFMQSIQVNSSSLSSIVLFCGVSFACIEKSVCILSGIGKQSSLRSEEGELEMVGKERDVRCLWMKVLSCTILAVI